MALSEVEELEMLRLRKQKAMAGNAAPEQTAPKITAPAAGKKLSTDPLANIVGSIADPATEMATGFAGKVAGDVAGLAGIPLHMAGLTGGMDPTQIKQKVQEAMTIRPQTVAGQAVSEHNPLAWLGQKIGQGSEAIGGAIGGDGTNPYRQALGHGVAEAIPQGLGLLGMRYGPGAASATGAGVGKAAGGVKDFAADVAGSRIPGAKVEAGQAARSALESGADTLSKAEQHEAMRVKAMGDVRARLDKQLEASQVAGKDLNIQGGTVRTSYDSAMQGWKDARKATADAEFAKVRESATEKEMSGVRVDTKEIQSSLSDLIKEAHGIGDLESGLGKLLSAVRGKPPGKEVAAPTTVGKHEFKIAKPEVGAEIPKAKTFEELELARRYLNDIAYSGEAEGYSAILRNKARDTAVAIDKSMQDFLPEFGKYKENYRKMSEPLESLNTRLGKVMSGTEGGLKGEAYSKIANADLPGKLFGKKEGIDLMVDALAGGKNATGPARIKATAQVEQMAENWLLESLRGKKPGAAMDTVAAPQMRAALSGVPKVSESVTGKLRDQVGLSETSEKLGKLAQERSVSGAKAKDALSEIKASLKSADELMAQSSSASKKKGYGSYTSALEKLRETELIAMAKAKRANLMNQEQYKTAMELINRASSLEEASAKTRKILGALGVSGLALYGAKEVGGMFSGIASP